MTLLRQVAEFGPESSEYLDFSVSLCKPLNAEAFTGILEWSHCWLLLLVAAEVTMELCEIVSSNARTLQLRKSRPFPLNGVIVDIKPVHSLDLHS